MYIIWKVEPGEPPLARKVVLGQARTIREIRAQAAALLQAGMSPAQLYLFDERSEELGLSADWLEEWLAGTRKWPAE